MFIWTSSGNSQFCYKINIFRPICVAAEALSILQLYNIYFQMQTASVEQVVPSVDLTASVRLASAPVSFRSRQSTFVNVLLVSNTPCIHWLFHLEITHPCGNFAVLQRMLLQMK